MGMVRGEALWLVANAASCRPVLAVSWIDAGTSLRQSLGALPQHTRGMPAWQARQLIPLERLGYGSGRCPMQTRAAAVAAWPFHPRLAARLHPARLVACRWGRWPLAAGS